MTLKESKIAIVDRLRQLGVWEEASWWKDRRKQLLMADGLSRRGANERAWQEVEQAFDGENLERFLAYQIGLMAEFPPLINSTIADRVGEPSFNFVWKIWCLSLARLNCWENADFAAASAVAAKIKEVDATGDERELVTAALNEVNRLVRETVEPKFTAVIERLELSCDSLDEDYVRELRAHVRETARFRGRVKDDVT